MIRIGKYGADATERCYMVGVISRVTNKETGEEREVITAPSFYPTFEGVLRHVRKKMHLEAIRDADGDLDTAMAAIRTADEAFAQMISGIDEERRNGDERSGV